MNLGRNVLKILLFSVNLVVAGLFLITLLASRISPEKLLLPSYLSLGLPLYIIGNILFVFFWAVFRKWFFLLSLITLIIGIDAVQVALPLNYNAQRNTDIEAAEGFSLITYNTQANHMMASHSKDNPNPVIQYTLDRFPDVLLIQEFSACVAEEHLTREDLDKIYSVYPYKHVYYHTDSPWSAFGVATFSKFPIVSKGILDLKSDYNTTTYADIQLNDTSIVRIYNCHLESNKLTESDKQMATRLRDQFDTEALTGTTLHLSRKLGAAFRIRAGQADIVKAHVDQSPYPVIVAGDFNDVPYSYTYARVRGELKDIFQEKGFGFDYTFNESFFRFRIDQVFYDPRIELTAFKMENDQHGSDHFPLYCKFNY